MPARFRLEIPNAALLPGFEAALRRGWSPNNITNDSAELLARIESGRDDYLAQIGVGTSPGGTIIRLPDGSERVKLPSKQRWISDGSFCGSINMRWVPGQTALPDHVLGHVGYAVVPWKQGLGAATFALKAAVAELAAEGLTWVEVSTEIDNRASQRVIEKAGGVLIETFVFAAFGPQQRLRYQISTAH